MSAGRRRVFRLPWRSTRQIRADVDEEFGFHVDMRIEALLALGYTPDRAREQALREFGDLEDARRYIGTVDSDIEAAQRRSDLMTDIRQDIAYAVRSMRGAPGFTITAILTLALGIGASTAIFSVVNGVLLKPMPFPMPDHLVRVQFTQRGQGDASTPPDLTDFRGLATSFVGFSSIEATTANLVVAGATDAERVPGVRVNANWFGLLRISPLAGRFFAEGEDMVGAPNVAVLSEELWRRSFGADPRVVGSTVRINATPHTIIGIVPAGRRYPITAELWMTKRFTPGELSDQTRGARWLGLYGRVKDDVPLETAQHEVTEVSKRMELRFPEVFRERRARAVPVHDFIVGDLRKPLYVILAAVAFVLLIACANVANLLLVRATAREGELAIRAALGAGRQRLIRQLMTESILLTLTGAAGGVALAGLGMRAIARLAPPTLALVSTASIDGTALAVTALVAVFTGIVFGILPASQVKHAQVAIALRAGGRGTRARHGASQLKRMIVVSEVALAVTLLAGAGLLLRSFGRLVTIDPGFRPAGVLSMKMSLPGRAYEGAAKRLSFATALEERVSAIPGVSSVGLSTILPLDGGSYGFTYTVRGHAPVRSSDQPSTEIRVVTSRYFESMGIPIVAGRGVAASDLATSEPVLVITREFAKIAFPNENPIGASVQIGWGDDTVARRIVGVVGDVRGSELDAPVEPMAYVPFAQVPQSGLSLVVRTSGAPASLIKPVRDVVRQLDRELPVYSVMSMDERVAGSLGSQRFYATLIGIFAGVALVLAAIGLYGVIAYAVSQRTHELGVRVALGATAHRISRMVITEVVQLTIAGVVLGLAGAAATTRVIGNLLYDVRPRDPATFAGVAVVLILVAAVAGYLPARRAARVDPLQALRTGG